MLVEQGTMLVPIGRGRLHDLRRYPITGLIREVAKHREVVTDVKTQNAGLATELDISLETGNARR